MRRLRLIPWSVLLLALGSPVAAAGAQGQAPPSSTASGERDALVRADAARSLGSDTAMVVLIEFFDYSCASCQQFHLERGDSLRAVLGADVRLVYMGYLIPRFPRSFHAAEAALCAASIGGSAAYLAMSDRLFRGASEWQDARETAPIFARYAAGIAIDALQFAECTARDQMAPVILSDLSLASNFEVGATPTFVAIPRGADGPEDIGRLEGGASIAQLTELIATVRARAK
jgi:protein-disulfide isomerase